MPKLTNAIMRMYELFEKTEQQICGDCKHFNRAVYRGAKFNKCDIYGWSHSIASDFRVNWTACGHFNKDKPPFETRSVMETYRPSKEQENIDGQIGINEVMI